MSNNSKKEFKQATISSFFKTPKTKKTVNELPSYSNINLSQFKKVHDSKVSLKRSASEEIEVNISEKNTDVSISNKRRNIYKSYHNALQKFKFTTISHKPTNKNTIGDSNTTLLTETDKSTLKINSNKSYLNIGDLSKFNSSISSTESKASKKIVYTPLEQQYLEIKKKNPNTLLAIEVGYKYRFFDDDALTVSKVLGITCYKDHNFYSAVIPVHRLMIHLRKLVRFGYKIGIVNQLETSAIKAESSSKNKPFVRELTKIYTKSTFIDDVSSDSDSSLENQSLSSTLVCIYENTKKNPNALIEKTSISIVSVDLSAGSIIYDSFQDDFTRNKLETRLVHMLPSELLLPSTLSNETEKIISNISVNGIGFSNESIRIERSETFFKHVDEAYDEIKKFYNESSYLEKIISILDEFKKGTSHNSNILICINALLKYLKEFKLESVLYIPNNFSSFEQKNYLTLNGNTITNLEIFRNSKDNNYEGTLFELIDNTKSKFGRRLLKKWIEKPLVNINLLNERINAVEELINGEIIQTSNFEKLKKLLSSIPDIEKALCHIFYKRCSLSELVDTLIAFDKISNTFPEDDIPCTINSPLLKEIITSISIPHLLLKYLGKINISQAKENDVLNFLRDTSQYPNIRTYKGVIDNIKKELDDHLCEIRKKIHKPNLEYISVSGIEYLLEFRTTQCKNLPLDWIKINNTKTFSRYRTPFIEKKLKEKDLYSEKLLLECNLAYKDFLNHFTDDYEKFKNVVNKLSILDCLLSLSIVATQPGYVKPIYSEENIIEVKDGRNPITEVNKATYVPNDVLLNDENKCMIITGPNMGGKSNYVRQVALIVVLSQIGSYVPAKYAKLGLFDGIYTRMGAQDNIMKGQSTFMVELQETSNILKYATPRSLIILDEFGRGTSTYDGIALAYSTLSYILENINATTLFITHFSTLGSLESKFSQCHNFYMNYVEDKEENENKIIFLYKIVRGITDKSYGINVAMLANIPKCITDVAVKKSKELENSIQKNIDDKRLWFSQNLFKRLYKSDINDMSLEELYHYLDLI
ncbi:hypothetical protein BCR36DRAFT_411844 [Piromyces finnis]|uniref:DNA mismatch repair protein MSH3 n=1 Tax=Piromyces finnis TaxID=1754191 RepID=A0A1Y1VAU7_9FUNG|nr:hypothetical protein BCR36DRAFT_411844 [Piromyces finnis]|eukprot:ORX51377.1 hypothetical protein BCR36DRAFT_411844 [Piromyces finnis]